MVSPGSVGDKADRSLDRCAAVTFGPVALAMGRREIRQFILTALGDRDDVVDGECKRLEVGCLIVDVFATQVAWRSASGYLLAMPVAPRRVTGGQQSPSERLIGISLGL